MFYEDCKECESVYHLSENKPFVNSFGYKYGSLDIGVCEKCLSEYYLDIDDYKCKSNKGDEVFYFCNKGDSEGCKEYLEPYYLGENRKCTNTENCAQSINGTCVESSERNFFFKEDNSCTNVEHCVGTEKKRRKLYRIFCLFWMWKKILLCSSE